MARTDVVVIDREVGDSDTEHRGERLDLLALQETEPATYRFLAIEVKLGNNAELDTATQARTGKRSAVEQVRGYAEQIDRCFDAYADLLSHQHRPEAQARSAAQRLGGRAHYRARYAGHAGRGWLWRHSRAISRHHRAGTTRTCG